MNAIKVLEIRSTFFLNIVFPLPRTLRSWNEDPIKQRMWWQKVFDISFRGCSRSVWKISSYFEYLENFLHGSDVTWQPVKRGEQTHWVSLNNIWHYGIHSKYDICPWKPSGNVSISESQKFVTNTSNLGCNPLKTMPCKAFK